MIALLILAGVVQATPAAPPPEPVDEIVVTAVSKTRCRIRFADRDMNDAELRRRSTEWAAGKPLRVVARASTDLKCLSKIAFKLADRGVTRIRFIEPQDVAPVPAATPR